MHNITFFEVTEPKEAYRSAVNNLLTQLSQNAKPMTIDEMTYMATWTRTYAYRKDNKGGKEICPLLTSANVTPVTHRSKCALSKHWVREKRNQYI